MVSIKITLLGRQIPLRVAPTEVERIREIALHVNDLMVELRDQIANQPDATILSLGALRLAEELFREREQSRSTISELKQRLETLAGKVTDLTERTQVGGMRPEASQRTPYGLNQERTATVMGQPDRTTGAVPPLSSPASHSSPAGAVPPANVGPTQHSTEIQKNPVEDQETQTPSSPEDDVLRHINRRLERFLEELGE